MNIFWLSAEIPSPPNTGGRIVVYKRLQYMSQNNNIYLFSVVDNDEETICPDDLKTFCKEVHLYNRHTRKNRLKTLLNLWRGPIACVSRTNSDLQADLKQCCRQNEIDRVIVEFPQMLANVPVQLINEGKVIVEQHNIEYVTLNNLAHSIHSPLRKLIFAFEAKRMKHWEEYYYRKPIALYTFVSHEDKVFFERHYPTCRTYLSPIGAEINRIDIDKVERYSIMYFGKMSYSPNADAAKWFVENVFVKVLEKYPDSHFYIVGKDPQPCLYELQSKYSNIIVTGTIDSVDEYYQRADIVVVPLKFGGGVKTKVLEALGYGKLVITTDKGIEGTDFEAGKEVLVARSAGDFLYYIVSSLAVPGKFANVSDGGLQSIRERYTWEAIVDKFETFIESRQ